MIEIGRRNFLLGALATPFIIRVDALMPVKRWGPRPVWLGDNLLLNGAELNAQEFPNLYTLLGHAYGGFGDRFNIPLLSPDRGAPHQFVYCMTQQGVILPTLETHR
jgi:hypothetical protein